MIEIYGGNELNGSLRIHGAKNAILPVLAATTLNAGLTTIHDCPNITDVESAFNILRGLGCSAELKNGTATVDSTGMCGHCIPEDLMTETRCSLMFLGAILSRCGKAIISTPGGCPIGQRPIDIHIDAFRKLGVEIIEDKAKQTYNCSVSNIKGNTVHLKKPSVGATENILLLTSISSGRTIIHNAAREPEIVDLQDILNRMGARIRGAGSSIITIDGVDSLHGCEYTIIPDRIATATYMCAVCACGGDVTLNNVNPRHLVSVIRGLETAGCIFEKSANSLRIKSTHPISSLNNVITMPHPGFPTDAQPVIMAAMCTAKGTSVFEETVFESRFRYAQELKRMGADIDVSDKKATVRGIDRLTGAEVTAQDLRGGAALVVAGLAATGKTIIHGVSHIDRGYEGLEANLSALGARVRRL